MASALLRLRSLVGVNVTILRTGIRSLTDSKNVTCTMGNSKSLTPIPEAIEIPLTPINIATSDSTTPKPTTQPSTSSTEVPNLLVTGMTNTPETSSIRQSSSNGDAAGKLYELRTYSVYPEKMREFLKLTTEEFHLRTAHSVLLGYWTVEIGGLNQVVHLWEYDSLCHRAEVRARLAGDPEWLGRYVSKVIGSWQQQDNLLLTLLPGTSLNAPHGTGVYQILSLNLVGAPAVWSAILVEYVKNSAMTSGSILVGAWKTALGPGNVAVILWQHPDPDGCIRLREASDNTITNVALQNHVVASHSKLLLPHTVSDWK